MRDGLVGVKRMEKAFQRQVIYGGALDTILLEMGLVPEDRLTQYLALATGLPPANRIETAVFDPDAVKRCPEEVAHKHRVAPLQIDNGALRVLVCDPVDLTLLEDLADVLDLPVQPLIVPEYRWHVVFSRSYDKQAPARFATLAKQAEVSPVIAPIGRSKTVIVETLASDSAPDHVVVDVVSNGVPLKPAAPDAPTMRFNAASPDDTKPQSPRAITAELSTPALARHLDEQEALRRDAAQKGPVRHTLPGFAPVAASVVPPPEISESVPPPQPMPRAREDAAPAAPHSISKSGSVTGSGIHRLPTGSDAEPPPPGDGPIKPTVARGALATADDRDAIFALLLRAFRSRARYAGLLTVQGGAAIGRLALAEEGVDASAVGSVLIPLDAPSAFANVLQTKVQHIGAVETGDDDIDGMLLKMGGVVPPAALLLPIALRERVIAIAYAHNLERGLGVPDVAELLPLGAVVSEALGRLIVKQKSIGYRAPSSEPMPVIEIDGGEIPTKRIERRASEWSVPDGAPQPPELDHALEQGTELSIDAAPPGPIAELLDTIESSDETAGEAAIQEAIARAPEVMLLLGKRFPGKLRVDRYQVSGRALRAAQYGGLLDLCVRLGSPAADLLIEKMNDTHRDSRFYATVCAAETRPRNAIYALVERLFDPDYGVRGVAVEALAGYPVRELDLAMVRCRHALHSDDPERVAAAAHAIAELGDMGAMNDLIDTVGRDGKRGEHVRRALIALTKQDLGTSERKWRKWWEEQRKHHRIEWLIDGLVHKDAAIRQSAAEDLRKLTGEYFGFHHDLPKKEREASQTRWRQWWNETGRHRFVRNDDERHRPTAVVKIVEKKTEPPR
ncbi:MAG TPA: hypothetical protein VL463_08050 [Kofleriaceae bacterium]|nr:hypothetical protein [Kofleriaceae bacterium]